MIPCRILFYTLLLIIIWCNIKVIFSRLPLTGTPGRMASLTSEKERGKSVRVVSKNVWFFACQTVRTVISGKTSICRNKRRLFAGFDVQNETEFTVESVSAVVFGPSLHGRRNTKRWRARETRFPRVPYCTFSIRTSILVGSRVKNKIQTCGICYPFCAGGCVFPTDRPCIGVHGTARIHLVVPRPPFVARRMTSIIGQKSAFTNVPPLWPAGRTVSRRTLVTPVYRTSSPLPYLVVLGTVTRRLSGNN